MMASIWVDYLERNFLDNEFKELVNSGLVNGITSNPAIFANAITKSDAYKEDIEKLKGKSGEEIYEELAVKDIQKACDVLEEKYNERDEGFASIEVNQKLANDYKGTVDEALRLVDKIQRDNVMIKIPATEAGYKAMADLAKRGININATLVFSPNQAMQCAESLSNLPANNEGVISVFVSRFDRALNDKLAKVNLSKDRIGFFNAIKIYNQINEKRLPNVKTLFASTGVKQNYLEPDYYVTQLNLDNSVLTLPLDVINYIKNKELNPAFEFQTKHIDAFFSFLTPANISMQQVYETLMKEGLEAFENSFNDMLNILKG
jgi:transaldolase